MKYHIKNEGTRGKAFKVFGGTEVVGVGKQTTIDIEGEVCEAFIARMRAADVFMTPVADDAERVGGYGVKDKGRGWFAVTLDGAEVTKSLRAGDIEDFKALCEADKAAFVDLHKE